MPSNSMGLLMQPLVSLLQICDFRRAAGAGAALWISLVSPAWAGDSASDWVMRINDAAANMSFAGSFVYMHDNEVEAMEVVRRVKNGVMQERLYALNGDAREVVRDKDRIWCFIPDKNMGVHDYRQTSESGFPRILPGDISTLEHNYQFSLGGTKRIARRDALQVLVTPKDKLRYGYHLWADTQSGLLLQSDLVDDTGNVVEQYMFVDIDIGREISDQELASVTSKEKLTWYGTDRPNLTSTVDDARWQVEEPPSGYRLTKHIRRMTPMEMEEEEHLVFTDGLSSVSVFVKKARKGQSGMMGLSRMGAVHAYRDTIGEHWVTVMGEVPAETVTALASRITYRP